jgi:2-aminoethylphosphonate-pyruvate transaminase
VLLAFRQALREFFAEGGIAARQARYIDNHRTLMRGMDRLGFVPFLARQMMSHIITTFHCPDDPAYDFQSFYGKLSERGMVIYPGKVTGASCFRIGNIGRLYSSDMDTLLLAIESVVRQMDFDPGRVEQTAASR